MKVVGLSGAQGAGKSSMLKELMARGWKLDEFRVSRAVQAQLGWENLDRVLESSETMMEFQEEVYRQKFARDSTLASIPYIIDADPKSTVVLTERTFADIWAYASHWTWTFHDQGDLSFQDALETITPYLNDCIKAQNQIYSGVLLLPMMDHIVWEDDPNRAKQNTAQQIYEDVARFVDRKLDVTIPSRQILSKSVQERADEVEQFLRTL